MGDEARGRPDLKPLPELIAELRRKIEAEVAAAIARTDSGMITKMLQEDITQQRDMVMLRVLGLKKDRWAKGSWDIERDSVITSMLVAQTKEYVQNWFAGELKTFLEEEKPRLRAGMVKAVREDLRYRLRAHVGEIVDHEYKRVMDEVAAEVAGEIRKEMLGVRKEEE